MNPTFYKIRVFLNMIEKFSNLEEFLNKLLEYFYENMGCSSIIIDNCGEISKYNNILENSYLSMIQNEDKIRDVSLQKINSFNNILFNFKCSDLSLFDEYNQKKEDKFYGVLIPINVESTRILSILLFKQNSEFLKDEEIIFEIVSSFILMICINERNLKNSSILKKNDDIISAINILSYTEIRAIQFIINELNGNDGILIASRVADKVGITRSVIVNALRKLEGARIIQTTSMGVKGTRIKFLVPINMLKEAICNK